MGFEDQFAEMEAAQQEGEKQEAEKQKAEEEKAAAEKADAEREGQKTELAKQREAVSAELALVEQHAGSAQEAIARAELFAAEKGANLQPKARAAIEAIKNKATETLQKFAHLKAEVSRIDGEISALGGKGGETVKAATEAIRVEAPPEAQAAVADEAANADETAPAGAGLEKESTPELTAKQKWEKSQQDIISASDESVKDAKEIPTEWKSAIVENKLHTIRGGTSYVESFFDADDRGGSRRTFPELMAIADPSIAQQVEKIVDFDDQISALENALDWSPEPGSLDIKDEGIGVRSLPPDLQAAFRADVGAANKESGGDNDKLSEAIKELRTGKYKKLVQDRLASLKPPRRSLVTKTKDQMRLLNKNPKYAAAADKLIEIQVDTVSKLNAERLKFEKERKEE